MIKLSIIIPCYNEEKNIFLIFEKFSKIILRNDIEVLFVNNGSTDNSEKIFKKLAPNYPFARIVKVDINKGYGFGIKSGLNKAKGEFIGYTHADLQTDPADVLRALEIIEKQENPKMCYVKGDRKKRPIFDQFFTVGMSIFETIYLKTKLWDINAQPNIFHRSFYKDLDEVPNDFSLDLFLLYIAKKKGYKILRFNVFFPPRLHGESKWNTGFESKIKFIKRTIDFSSKLKKHL